MMRVEIDWRADGGGSAEYRLRGIWGWLERIVTVPDATDAPTDNYDVTLEEYESGADLLEGQAANRDTANTEVVYPISAVSTGHARIWLSDQALLKVDNAGADNAGIVCLYLISDDPGAS